MNKTKIEWCDYTWNPITGCLHGCDYCYARRIAKRFKMTLFDEGTGTYVLDEPYRSKNVPYSPYPPDMILPYPFGFDPTFHRYRLTEPQQVKKPQKIFVCSISDLFGDWVPDEWIEEVMDTCKKASQHTFMFLTKNPKRYGQNNLYQAFQVENVWLGTTITSSKDAVRAKWLLAVTFPETNTFLSIEPLLEPIGGDIAEIYPHNQIKWVIVGAQTGPGAVPPKPEWVQSIIDQCKDAGVPVFLKDNLKWPEKIQEWPETE